MIETICSRYSGQQKLPTSSWTAPPAAPPPVLRPKPLPRAGVSATALPSCGTGPVVAVLPLASFGAGCGRADGFGRALGSGSVIAGAVGAGAVSARRTGSGGAGAC